MDIPVRLVHLAAAFDFVVASAIIINDLSAFLPNVLFLALTAYIVYRIGYQVSNNLFWLLFNKSSLKETRNASHLFAVYLLTVFLAISFGSPPSLGLVSCSELFPIALLLSLVLGGVVFSYLFTKEMLKQTDLQNMKGVIPSFWNKLEKTGKEEDFESQWKKAQRTPSKIARTVLKTLLVYSPSIVLIFVVLMNAELFYFSLFFSMIFDAILVGWIVLTVWARVKRTSAKIGHDAEESLAQALHSEYYRFSQKAVSLTIAMISTMIGVLSSFSSFIVACLAIPSVLTKAYALEGLVGFIILLAPLVSYQLYYWSLLLRRSQIFLRASRNLSLKTQKAKVLPVWSAVLFVVAGFILPVEDLLLGHRFFSYNAQLSLSFIQTPSKNDLLAIGIAALISIIAFAGLVRMLLKQETNVVRREVLRDNILYGVILASVWFSVILQLFITRTSPPQYAVFLLFFSTAMLYLPDLAEKIKVKFSQRPILRSIFYYGVPIVILISIIDIAAVLSIIETLYAVVFSIAFVILLVFVLWLDLRFVR